MWQLQIPMPPGTVGLLAANHRAAQILKGACSLTVSQAGTRLIRGRSKQLQLALAVLVAASLLAFVATVPTAQAGGQNFCTHAWLDRYGQQNDNCAANDKHYNYAIVYWAEEHSVCASVTTNTSKSGVIEPWACTPGPYEALTKYVSPKNLTNGIIRNNTPSDTNHGSGQQNWCSVYNCGQ
jgi:hypothetical protein